MVFDVRIITDVVFSENDKCWMVCTDHALQDAHDPNKFIAADSGDIVDIKIASGSTRNPGLGTFIKRFNEHLSGSWFDGEFANDDTDTSQ